MYTELRSKVDMDEMRNAELQTSTLKPDDPTKTSMSLVIPTQLLSNWLFHTRNANSSPAYSNSFINQAFTSPNEATNGPTSIFPHSCHSLRQQPKKTSANSRTVSQLVSVCDPNGVLTLHINQNASRLPTSGQSLQSKLLSEQLSRKVPYYTICIHHTHPLKWRIDTSNIPEIQENIFQVTPSEGTLANGQEDEFIVSFFTKEEAENKLSIPLFLNGEKSEYCDITVTALGIKQQLVFEPKELVLLRFLNTSFLASRISAWPESMIEQREDPEQTARRNHADDDDDWKHNPCSPASFVSDQNSDVALKTARHTNSTKQRPATPLPSSDHVVYTERLLAILSELMSECVCLEPLPLPVPDVNDILFAAQKSQETLETFAVVSNIAWTTLLLQIIKLFVLSKVTLKRFKALPGIFKEEKQKETPTKVIELQNPSQRTLQFTETVSPRNSNPIKATFLFIPKSDGGGQVHPIAMQLVTKVLNPTPSATYSVTTPLYGCAYCEVEKRNQFPNESRRTSSGANSRRKLQPKTLTPGGTPKLLGTPKTESGPVQSRTGSRATVQEHSPAQKQQVQHDTIKLAEKADFCPCRLNAQQLTLTSGATGTIQVQFQPISVGVHRCRVMFCDEDQGEFTVEIEEISTIPAPSESFIIIGQADKAENSQLEKALFPLLPTPGNSLTYQVESTSPLFSIPKELQILLEQPQGLKKALSTADGQKTDTSGGRVRLPFSFRPKQAGEYMCRVVLKSALEIRIFDIKGIAQSPGMEATIDLQTIARKPVSQEIPNANPTLTD
ncbi:hypothetical protein BLNAU_12789 [Blattamonas nauphoetae]|uniref:Uncharacterized protein n=1 Tax=Blattamonas nauphoetae TaxID=2049346 RepID=A0ABQ9XM11_9EUKA|nr:hypothetical protein BLNAU_12789 [Blattamonas nauphoetae]